jgi:hypothetical protein
MRNLVSEAPARNPGGDNVEEDVFSGADGYEEKIITKSLQRIATDDAKFSDGITAAMYFENLKRYIGSNPNRSEMVKRLRQELIDMDESCSTGVVARLVNVLQGFGETPESLKIKMDPLDEIRSSLTARLNHAAQKDPDIMDKFASTDPADRAHFLSFVALETKRQLPTFLYDYAHICPVVLKTAVTKTLESYVDSKADARDIVIGAF